MPDLYRLTTEQLLELDGYGEISARNAIAAIEASRKTIPFRRVLFGLNIPDVGWVTAQNLARHFGTVDRLLAATPEELIECEGIGPERAEAIAEWFADEDNRRSSTSCEGSGCASSPTRATGAKEGPLTGQPVRDHRHARVVHARGGEGARSRRSAPRSPTASRRRRPA